MKKETKTESKAPKKVASKKTKAAETKTLKAVSPAPAKAAKNLDKAKGTSKISEKEVKPEAKSKASALSKTSKESLKVSEKGSKVQTKKAKPESVEKEVNKPVAEIVKETKKTASKNSGKLASSFNPEYLVLMQKDPNWMHAFWEVSESRLNALSKGKNKVVLRLFDISGDLTVKRKKQKRFRDIVVPSDARSWYVENPASKATAAVLGTVSGNKFTPILESTPVLTFDKDALAPNMDDAFVRASLGGATLGNFMSSGFSSQTAGSWLESLRLGSSSESISSGALSSASLLSGNEIVANADSVNYGKDFFLWVKTRLIVYGGTRPDAHLQVRGEPFPLNPDGTFSFEEDLPDSTKVIPVFATDKDGDFPTTIVPIVVKRTE